MTEETEKAKLFAYFNQLSNKHKKEILKKVEELVESEREKHEEGKADKIKASSP
jgi:ribosomal protein L18E